ncbi:FAD-dependent oxidoreductase [Escherichia coli]|uniref:FAD-dependent oxidoreductase n=1 Tax=Escherichia coli TaxID=562 RepID=UPI000BE4DF39|nr:FAD-dependent oxidoreductase [Escherichia coli]EES4392049.1 FAD-dependent oxidoreductase [Escherichia coli]EFJ9808713.1 FAD-dependent oxidoreductase [Escherichia coli]EFK0624222.1 FAD-dependent oxidoreductase [Escherichia coli]EFK2015332.1 FAD-dependent oxidoreductase [Escherichia coli]EIY3013100.1 FAD-dependent oxidoreductase [Escherichia coli]
MSTIFDVAVMGGGPGGYVAALRAAQNGLSVVCIDDGVNAQGEPSPGGTCLNVGCIPSKSLLQSSELYAQVQHEASIHGVNVDGVSFNAAAMIQRKDAIVSRLTMGIGLLFKKNKVKYLCGLATLEHARDEIWQLRVNDQQIRARNVVIATGSQPRLGVIGAGVIGLELGSVWNRVGSDVTLLEMAPTFLPALEARLSNEVRKAMIASGMKMQLAVEIEAIEQRDDGVHVRWRQGEKREESRFDKLILAIGRVPRLSGVDLVQLGLEADNRGGIAVDNLCRTGKAGLWAIGDVVRGPMLAHKAMAEGVVVADQIAGLAVEPINFALIPSVIYTQPEVAWVGENEASLKAAGRVFNKGNSLFAGNGRALALGQEGGRCTLYSDKHTDRVLGGAIVGPQASELINEIALAMTFSASGEDIACAIHAHPTLSEVIHEAAMALNNKALHG